MDRLLALALSADEVMVVVDHPFNADALDCRAREANVQLDVLVDVDVGQHRTGVVDAGSAVFLAREIANARNLRYRGVQAYWGHLQHVPTFGERIREVENASAGLRGILASPATAGLAAEIVSGGGTGTHLADARTGVHTELQPGSYIFMDRQYHGVELLPGGGSVFEQALFVQTTVVSTNQPDIAVVNGGWKAFATEGGVPVVARGASPGSPYKFLGDEHGGLSLPPGVSPPTLGTQVGLIPPHCDPTVNLFAFFHCVRGEELVDIWPIEGHGN